MKTLFLIVACIVCIQLTGLAQQDSLTLNGMCQSKIVGFTKMKNTGSQLTIMGATLTIAGIVLVSSSEWKEETNNYNGQTNYTTNDPSALFGMVFIAAGVESLIAGIIVRSIGSSKVKQYKRKLGWLSLKTNCSSEIKGLTLTYNF
jgi:hypothetical protein